MVTPDQRIKFAVIGCGHIGKRHAEMISRNPESELVGLVDIKDKAALQLDQFNVPF
jgi:predicted dehydrogenase